ncbi:hypothetical protein ATJ88_3242 [Isoptericola jiangsuensis]|uniref:Uncharacterized protein n=1 Tax=Isoptericola jiangsuensis TaxID=548579 RepID=A0A2A9EZE7_9MICO|nr:hypothetical protein [Isoptericola jiangsuensis]PFG44517.1 hypothetical protein ATJ88_3242 [Isoptericola jiangsuensis]
MSVDELTRNIVRTVATAETILTHFEDALRRSGFAEGAEQYGQLADTLLGQRMWAASSGQPSGARFGAVGERAQAIHALLLPYVEAFRKMGALAEPALADPPPTDDAPQDADVAPVPQETGGAAGRVLAALERSGRPLSMTALRAELRVPRAELDAAVRWLGEEHLVEVRDAGGRQMVRSLP